MKLVQSGWLKGEPIRTARKAGRCEYWFGDHFCPNKIKPGDQYIEGDGNDNAGGYGRDRYCMDHVDPKDLEDAA